VGTNATVRISGNTPPLIAGFTATAVGRGAICMTCHNSRRGLHNDTTFPAIAGTAEVTSAPHGSAQTDVVMGENAYFVNTGVRGAHSLVEDSCVACHMVQTPPPAVLSYQQSGTNHTFFADTGICTNCHGAGSVNAAMVQGATGAAADVVKGLIETATLELIDTLTTGGATIDLNGLATVTSVSDIANLDFTETRGRQAFTITMADTTVIGPLRVNDIDVIQPPAATTTLFLLADDRLVKAGWNWVLIHNDGSGGIHYPSFTLQVLDASKDQLMALLGL
jgi:hypothetical protein